MKHLTSRDNPLLKELRRLSQDTTAYRKSGRVWLEGDHLCRAALTRGVRPAQAVLAESVWASAAQDWHQAADEMYVVPDAVFDTLSSLESPGRMGFVLTLPASTDIDVTANTVVLDRLQDAGNVGAILRSASAFGFKQVLAIKGTAALWSPKVLRAGMGAHFGMRLIEGFAPQDLQTLQLPVLTTSSHQGPHLHELVAQRQLPSRCAWVLGHEGQGVSEALQQLARLPVRIAQPGGEESLNVAAAAAICLHASATAASG